MAKYVVTGGAGFIGSHLVRALVAEGHKVTVVDNLSTGDRKNLAEVEKDIEIVVADVRDTDLMRRVCKGADVVFHQAALPSVPRSIADPWSTNDHNVNGTLSILIAARDAGVRRFIYAGSSSVYGNTTELPKRETMPATPLSPYAVSKYAGELYCQVFCRAYGLETVVLRYFNVFGPRQNPDSPYAAVIPRFIRALLRRESPTIFGDGEQTRDFTYVENVVNANLAASRAPAGRVAGEVFNVGMGMSTSLKQLLGWLADITGFTPVPVYAPPRAGDVRASQADISKARQAFGYEPSVSLLEGLRRTVEWFSSARASS